jgi:hydrogenase large subunit
MLGHWLQIKNGVIENYRVITPTGWNFSPRDANDRPGPVEEALLAAPVKSDSDTTNIRHIVNSFDPCLYCSVH